MANEVANKLSTTELTEVMKNVTGKGEAVARKIATTFRTLSDLADWESAPPTQAPSPDAADSAAGEGSAGNGLEGPNASSPALVSRAPGLKLHSDVHIHLPATSDVSVYTAIFRAVREELID